ncbi:MAG: DUF58 domain-containing protein [Fimbriimonas sp.]|nr:DUF58 domain-containing protein [Fimbriimonas sp.]
MVPTKRFWMMVAAGIPLAAISAWVGSPMIGVAYDILLVGTAFASTFFAPSTARLSVRRRLDSVLSVRASNRIVLVVENGGQQPVTGVLRDEPPPFFDVNQREFRIDVSPRRPLELAYHVTPYERGSERFRGTFLRIDCPLGLAVKQVRLPTEQPVRVYPNVLALREFDLLKQQGRLRELGIRRSRARGLGTDFESLRDYADGDDYRKIDWKASARRGKLVVRQYEQERNQCVILCIDVGRHMLAEVDGVRKLDHVLDALLMLTNAAAMAGDFVGLLVYADSVRRYIPPRKGRGQVGVIIEAIHDLVAEPVESDPIAAFSYLSSRWKRRSLIVNFTDYEDPDRARELSLAIGPLARRHLTLICRVQDPRIDEVLKMPVETVPEMYRKAAANFLMEDRRAATSIVGMAGIRNLDSEPQDLATNLVSYYFHVKERSLL